MKLQEMGIEGVIFDMDGVLLFSNEIHASAYRKTFSDFGLKGFDHTSISGMRTDEVMKIMLHKNDMPTSQKMIDDLTKSKRAYARDLFAHSVPLLENVDHLLEALKERDYKVALATSASQSTMNSFLQALSRDYFDFTICGTEVEFSKPDPEIYMRAMVGIDTNPGSCLVVEDSLNGLQAGKSAGAKLCAVLGTIEKKDLEEFSPHMILDHAGYLKDLC